MVPYFDGVFCYNANSKKIFRFLKYKLLLFYKKQL